MARIRRGSAERISSVQPNIWKVGKYIRLSRDDGNSESESITNQRKILDEQIPGYFDNDYDIVDEYIDATDIIGLKQNPTNGRRFSPIFVLSGHFPA